MKKLDWITWKTLESELINPDEIEDKLKDIYKEYNSYMNPVVYETVKYEIDNGGLHKNAFIINHRSPANEVGNKIISDIEEVKELVDKLIKSVKEDAIEQRKIEIKILIKKIEEKIEKDKKLIENSKEAQKKYTDTSLYEASNSIQGVINITQERIDLLTKKIERLSSL